MSDAQPTSLMLSPAGYAQRHGISLRTVRRHLAAERLEGARQLPDGEWMIPADAPVVATGAAVTIRPVPDYAQPNAVDNPGHALDPWVPTIDGITPYVHTPTLSEKLDALPVLVPLEDAAELLGTTVGGIRRHREVFGAEPYGPRGRLVVPAAFIRRMAGL